jgi:basic membrane protein A and related proteins
VKTLVALVVLNALLLAAGLGFRGAKVAEKRIRIGLVFDVGGLGDKSFNDAAYRGLERAEKELDIEFRYVEPGDGSDRESAIRELAAEGRDLVIGVGFVFTDDIRAAAERFPDVKFACIDYAVVPGQPPPPPNLAALRFREEEGSFLVGAMAALVSKSKKVGFVGGMDIPLIRKFEAGYRAGVAAVCPACQLLAAYAGTEPKAFADPTMGKELALAQYARGVDIIYHASGKTGVGVFNAARERGRLAIGVDSDQFHEAPCCVMTSMVKGVDVAVFDVIAEVSAGQWKGGVVELGLAEGGVGYVLDERNRHFVPAEVEARVEALRQEIIAGRIQVPAK